MPRWVAPVVIATTVVIAVVLGVLWYVIGGWPRDHDRYGAVPIPGQRTLELPDGEVRLAFEGEVSGGTRTRTLEDPPDDLRVRITRGGRELPVEDVSGSLYGVFVGGRGHEPFGKVEVPEAGRYRVRTVTETGSPSGEITAGPELWNPGGSRLLGALAVFVASLLVLLVLDLPFIALSGRSR
jgi:hypothetical protein